MPLLNVYTGTKNAFKAIGKVCSGKVKSEGKTWFRELSDKSTYDHNS